MFAILGGKSEYRGLFIAIYDALPGKASRQPKGPLWVVQPCQEPGRGDSASTPLCNITELLPKYSHVRDGHSHMLTQSSSSPCCGLAQDKAPHSTPLWSRGDSLPPSTAWLPVQSKGTFWSLCTEGSVCCRRPLCFHRGQRACGRKESVGTTKGVAKTRLFHRR